MTDLTVHEDERGVIRVFGLDADPKGFGSDEVASALGVSSLNPDGVEVISVSDLFEIGLSGYLVEGLGVAPESVTDQDLAQVGPTAVLVRSAAFDGATSLAPRAPLRFIGAWREANASLPDLTPMDVVSAHPSGALEPPLVSAPDTPPGRSWPVLTGLALAVLIVVLAVVILGGAP